MESILRILLLTISVINLSVAQWIQTNALYTYCLATNGNILFAGTYNQGIFLSTDNGANWTAVNNGLTNAYVNTLACSDTNLFAGTRGGIFLSTNYGTSWTATNTGLTNTYVRALTFSGTNLFAGTYRVYPQPGTGIFLSTNYGTSWAAVNTGLTELDMIPAFAALGPTIFASTYFHVYRSTNNGASWIRSDTGINFTSEVVGVTDFAVSDTNLFAAAYMNMPYISSDTGTFWSAISAGLTTNTIQALHVIPHMTRGGTVIAGSSRYGHAFLSTNNGTNWSEVSTGLPNGANDGINDFVVLDGFLFAGTDIGVWRRPLSELITSVDGPVTELPNRFALHQNYPNPFNPQTNISFDLPNNAFVSLKIFDLMGREVETILSENMSAGNYSKQWYANGLPSGVYFCRLQAGSLTETKPLVILK